MLSHGTTAETAFCRPWDAARAFVYPSAPPGCGKSLARQSVAAPEQGRAGSWANPWVRPILEGFGVLGFLDLMLCDPNVASQPVRPAKVNTNKGVGKYKSLRKGEGAISRNWS